MRADALGPKKPGRRGGRSLVERVPWAAVTVAFVVAVAAFKEIRYLGVPFTSSGDPAYTELSILRVFHGGVFLGPYSRFGWHHPGPLMFYLFAPIYGLSGDSSRALFLDSWLLNGASAIGTVLIAWKLAGPLVSAVFAAVVLAFMDIVGYTTWINPWNPSMLTLPLLLLMTAAAGATSGSLGCLVVAFLAGSFLVQTDLGTVPVTLVLLALAAGGFSFAWWQSRSPSLGRENADTRAQVGMLQRLTGFIRRDPGALRGSCRAARRLVALIWAPPLLQELLSRRGNISLIARFYLHVPAGRQHSHPLGSSLAAISDISTVVPAGYDRGLAWNGDRVALVVFVAALGVTAALIWWRRSQFLAWFSLCTPIGLLVGVLAATRIVGPVYPYLLQWSESLLLPAMIATLAWVAVVIRDLRWRRARSPWRVLAGATAAIAVSYSALVAWKGVDRNGPISFGDTPSARPLAADIVAALGSQRAKDVFQVRVLAYVNDDAALFVELAKQGLSFHVAPEIALFTGTTQATGGPVFLLGTPNTALPSTDHARPVASVGQVAVWESN